MFEQLKAELNQPYFFWIAKLLQAESAADVFLVGGAVRDAVLGRETKDYDFVVRGVPARKLQEFLGRVGIVNLVGRTFGVYKFVPEEGYDEFKAAGLEAFDVALPRTEHAWGTGGYRDVEVQSDHELAIEEDLGRRDFTMNAMALRLKSEILNPKSETNHKSQITNNKFELIDPFHGADNIKDQVIRAVGDPKVRFEEDYTRILRALRFACELGFAVDQDTLEALQAVMPQINDKRTDAPRPILSPLAEFVAPREMVSEEMLKAFYADPVRAFDLYADSGAFEMLMPELLKMKSCPQPVEYHSEGDVWTHTRMALEALGSEEYAKIFDQPCRVGVGPPPRSGIRPDPTLEMVYPHYNSLLIMAILFHDIGKPLMLRTPEEHGVDRIRFDEHAEVGAQVAREIARRQVLSIMEEGPWHVDYDKLHWLIKNHLLLLGSGPEELKASTVEKYFFNPKNPGEELLRLAFCDASATIPKGGGAPNISGVHGMMARIERMRAAIEKKQISPKALLDGDEIMEMLKIPAGPGVGEIKDALIEEQLSARITTKEQAETWLKEQYGY